MKYKHLSIWEREKIQELLWKKQSIRSIAKELDRPPSSISREIRRNLPEERYQYTPRLAHERALFKRKCRGRIERLKTKEIREYVISHLKLRWSPEQIAGRIKIDLKQTISYEAIYQFIYHQVHRNGYGYLKPHHEDLRVYLRRRRKRRQKKEFRRSQRIFKSKGNSIEERPSFINLRKRVGHWEGDSIESKDHKPGVNTLVERKVGLVFITKLKDKTSQSTVYAMEKRFEIVPEKFKQTVTLDNGPENSDWQSIERRTGLDCYYAHPYCSGERGTNENTNGLIRDYFPKKTDFDLVTNEEIQWVEYLLNTRPRKRLGWITPLEAWSVALQG
jgi:IS30 family transposase